MRALAVLIAATIACGDNAQPSIPKTVPAMREWTAANGSFTFTAASRIVVGSAELAVDAEVFAADLGALTGRTITVVEKASPDRGDVYLVLGGTDPDEGYTMKVGAAIRIQARTSAGVFYGTRSVLQLLSQSSTILQGTARDWPTKPERGLMIDQGRRFFSIEWIEQHIKELAYLKLNYFHFHLSDTFGFRLESATHPEVVSAQHYTKPQIRALIELGNRYHVTIVPEIDMPGHMTAILAAHPELQLDGGFFLDLSEPAAYALARDLVTEYLALFPARYWHMGGDEYVGDYDAYPQLLAYARTNYGAAATAKDTYYGFINFINDTVRAAGKTMRMWNDGIKLGDGTIDPASNIVVEYWYDYGLTPEQLLARGHTIANNSWDPTYYVTGGIRPDPTWAYEQWHPDLFQHDQTISDPSRNVGSNIHVWCDNPDAESEDQITDGIAPLLRILAQQTWGGSKPVATYADFASLADTVGRGP